MLGIGLNLSASGAGRKALFSRASTATYIDANGVLRTAGVNVPRYQGGSLLVEAAATNDLTYSTTLTNAPWVPGPNGNLTAGAADPAGGVNAYTLTAIAAYGTIDQTLSSGASVMRTSSVWLRRRTGAGGINLWSPDTGTPLIITGLPNTWTRYSVSNALASTARRLIVEVTTAGDSIDIFAPQLEAGSAPSSYIPTTSAPATRAADIIY